MEQKTAMMELKNLLEGYGDPQYLEISWDDIDSIFEEFIEKEKEQIMDAYWNGNSDGHIGENYINDYYNSNYKKD